jgi:phosphatidylethanolamine/phosphatidyl-N-methylethanolamine N-methyltransferase
MTADINKQTIEQAYACWAPFYDFVFGAVFEQGRQAAIRAAERVGGRVLEVGVGTGMSLPDYGKSTRLWGVDLSEPMLRKAQKRVRELNLRNVEGLAVMDAERLAFPDGSFDVIVAQHVITTVPHPEAALDELVRVLRPGGEIVLISRVGAESGFRGAVEERFTPLTRWLGWRLQFPWSRYANWVKGPHGMRLVERRSMPPFGHFSLIRFAKEERANAMSPRFQEAHASG